MTPNYSALMIEDREGIDPANLVEIARIFTFGTRNRRDIVKKLMRESESFKRLIFADALHAYRYAETNGLVYRGDGYLVVYHDTTDPYGG
ncbi:MAG: hypothetical protein LUE22_06465 [Oscillospiraceae bacterium]|nr:hypothetical protein [Oscillospiraceae bacterium]